MLCQVVMSFMISISNGPWECRTKHLPYEKAVPYVAFLNDRRLHPDIRVYNVKSQIMDEQFTCGDPKVIPDAKHDGCSVGPN